MKRIGTAVGRSIMNYLFAFIRVHSRLLLFSLFSISSVYAQQAGSIRGTVFDKEFNAPLAGAQVTIVETGEKMVATDEGNYLFSPVEPGNYTLVYSKEGYARQVNANVVVSSGQMTEAEAALSGEFTEMEEFVVQDLQMGGESEAGLLSLRQDSSGIMDAIGSEMMKKAGASTAASALTLVSGSTVQDGKYAVIRGLADRYTSTLVNGVRMPSSDPEKRAVHLDQFPAALIESMQVTKTFTPDQQGDASGGGINIVTRAVPTETIASFSYGVEYNTEATGNNRFRTNNRNTMDYWGAPKRDLDLPVRAHELPNHNLINPNNDFTDDEKLTASIMKNHLSPVVGTTTKAPGPNQSWSATLGSSKELGEGFRIGGIGTFSYSHKYSASYDTKLNTYNMEPGGTELESKRFIREDRGEEEVLTGLFAAVGAEYRDTQKLSLSYMRNHVGKELSAQRVEDQPTDADSTLSPLNSRFRQEIYYSERTLDTLQLHGSHVLGPEKEGMASLLGGGLNIHYPLWNWTLADSSSTQYDPDHTLFNVEFKNGLYSTGLRSATGLSRNWQETVEESDQSFTDFKLPFDAFDGEKGFFKGGLFFDKVERTFKEDRLFYRYHNNARARVLSHYGVDLRNGSPDPLWEVFETQPGWVGHVDHPDRNDLFGYYILKETTDPPMVDYQGEQEIKAYYGMADIPLWKGVHVIGGARWEWTSIKTDVDVLSFDDHMILFYVPESLKGKDNRGRYHENQLGADLQAHHVLPSLGFTFEPVKNLFLRGNWSKTIARPTFKELAPVLSPDDHADYFIGNPDLQISDITNHDLRLEWFRRPGDVLAVSWFRKDIKNPIDRIIVAGKTDIYLVPENFSEAWIEGVEFELRQGLDIISPALEGLSVGGNFTVMKSSVKYPQDMIDKLSVFTDSTERPIAGQPEWLCNTYLAYDNRKFGFSCGLFYTLTGEKLVAGESSTVGNDGAEYTPSIYEEPSGNLSFTLSKSLPKGIKLGFKASNLLDPTHRQVYRFRDQEVVRREYNRGISYSVSIGGEF